MDVMLQRHCARYIYVVPDGLRELMSDISREVLRSQPEDIYTFIADYLDALLITRENARVSARFVQYMTEASETIVELLSRAGMSREKADSAAEVIQDAFRTWSERKGILKEDEDTVVARIIEEAGISEAQVQAAAVVIQNAFRAFKNRQQREAQLLSGIIDWRVAARSAIRLYRRTGVSPEEAKRAANLIKAAYKGYYTRRAIRQLNETPIGPQDRGEDTMTIDDTYSISSSFSMEARKSKGVRIDYNTVVPHVDFGGEELISRDLNSILEEEVDAPQHKDVMMRIFGDSIKPEKTSEEFIREMLEERIFSALGTDDKVEPLIIDEKDSDTDAFVPPPVTEEAVEPQLNRSQILPTISQDELEQELMEARKEMVRLKQESLMRHTEQAQAVPTQSTPQLPEQAKTETDRKQSWERAKEAAEEAQAREEAAKTKPIERIKQGELRQTPSQLPAKVSTEQVPDEPPAETDAEPGVPIEAHDSHTKAYLEQQREAPVEAPPEVAEAPTEAPEPPPEAPAEPPSEEPPAPTEAPTEPEETTDN